MRQTPRPARRGAALVMLAGGAGLVSLGLTIGASAHYATARDHYRSETGALEQRSVSGGTGFSANVSPLSLLSTIYF